ncbi:hypothetical protein ABIA32_000809 [Streptacidiphilus sp. MAP12-20]|uniref:hypothetical protein n=1 Tax=Streptacidiphilus sp. MAP12-20 TaxID=3156299 RepID=UPI003513C71D
MSADTLAPSRHRAGALAGLLYVLFFLASFVLPNILGQNSGASLVTPYSTDAEVAHYLATTTRDLVPVAAFCQAMSALALLVFVPYAAASPVALRRRGATAVWSAPQGPSRRPSCCSPPPPSGS